MKIAVCGHFGGNNECYDGQTIKTRTVYNELLTKYSSDVIYKIDTYNWKKNKIKLFLKTIKSMFSCSDIIFLTAHNGVKIFIPLFALLNKFFHRKIHYIMIGCWLPEILLQHKHIRKMAKELNYIYVETYIVIDQLKQLELNNCVYMKNFKCLDVAKLGHNNKNNNTMKCCIFSRIEREKGIEDAIEVVTKLRKDYEISLDIYGEIKESFKLDFEKALKDKEMFIKYKGVCKPNDSVSIIKNYDLLLFPTRYETEGIPGTIIDSYFAGVPVLASRWISFSEVIDEDKTGLGYKFGDNNDFYCKLQFAINNRKVINKMKEKCIKKALDYRPENCMKILFENIDNRKRDK